MKLTRYDNYKPSGIEWIGDIPEGWKVRRIRGILQIEKEKSRDGKETLLSVSEYYGVAKKRDKIGIDDYITTAETLIGYKVCHKGNLVMNIMLARKTGLGVSNYDGIVSPAYEVFSFLKGYYPKYYNYLFRDKLYTEEFKKHSTGIIDSRLRLYSDKFLRLRGICPPLTEQKAIAYYLDEKIEIIDELISKKKEKIKLLEEKKTSLINHAVTKGLDKNVKLINSGIEWIGDIPEGWEVRKLWGISNFVRGNSNFQKKDLLSQGEYVALQYGNTYKVNEVDENFNFYVNSNFYKNSQIINHGDVILISTSETIDDLGHSVFYNRKDLGLLGGEQILIKPQSGSLFSKYLYYSSNIWGNELKKFSTGIKVFRFNISDLKTIYIPLPSTLNEQKAIADYLDEKTQILDQVIEKLQNSITIFKEYKQSLISHVVTGKVKVF